MNNDSRKTRREFYLCQAAKAGKFEWRDDLYKSEIKNLRRNGFVVEVVYQSNSKSPCTIRWDKPFGNNGIPELVSAYINGEIFTNITKNFNWAQELFMIASKFNKKQ